jgi:hypothetical protein
MASLDVYPPYDITKGLADMRLAGELNAARAQAGGRLSSRGARRSFTVDAAKTAQKRGVAPGGAYKSPAPLGAAKKAAGKLFEKAKKATRKIHFTLRETTRGSDKKELAYVATKHRLDHAKTIVRGDTKVHLLHKYDVKAE